MSGVYTKKCADDVLDDSEGALPFKLQRIAEEELGETPAMRQEAVEKLKQLLSGLCWPRSFAHKKNTLTQPKRLIKSSPPCRELAPGNAPKTCPTHRKERCQCTCSGRRKKR